MKLTSMENTGLEIIKREATVSEFLETARAIAGENAWLLLESPRKACFTPYKGQLGERLAREFASAVIFCAKGEARMEKTPGEERGFLRIIRHDPQGKDLYAARKGSVLLRDRPADGEQNQYHSCSRNGKVLLRDKPWRLLYAEYFREDESGFLVRECWRLCGVEGR